MAQTAGAAASKPLEPRKIGKVQQFFADDKRFLLVILLPVVLFFLDHVDDRHELPEILAHVSL